jgi:hypothetical protein
MDVHTIGWEGCRGLDLSGSGEGQMAGCCEHGNERWASVKCGEFVEWLRNC